MTQTRKGRCFGLIDMAKGVNNVKKVFNVPVTWTMYGVIKVEAESKEEAIRYAYSYECPLPDTKHYLDDSLSVDEEDVTIVE